MKDFFISVSLVITTTIAFAQANTSLNNLTNTEINQSLVPKSDNQKNLGSSSVGWKDLYLGEGGINIQDNFFVYSPSGGYDNEYYDNDYNTIVGWLSYYDVYYGPYPAITAIGYESLYFGDYYSDLYYYYYPGYMTAVGKQAAYYGLGQGNSVAIGSLSLFNTAGDGEDDVANGVSSLYNNTSGGGCAAEGADALYNSNGDGGNTACGWGAGYSVQTGYDNTFLGYNADCGSSGTLINSTAIGANASVTTSNTVRVGNSSVTSIGGFTNWTSLQNQPEKMKTEENVPGLAFIQLLKPVTYNYDLDAADKIMFPEGKPQDKLHAEVPAQEKQIEDQARQDKEKIVYSGFLAQDVEAAAEKVGYNFSGVEKPANKNSLWGLREEEFVVPLVKAVQELDEQQTAINDSDNILQSQTDDLEKKVSAMESELSAKEEAKISSSNAENQASLSQNIPNPFSQNTTIQFYIPSMATNAMIVVTDLSGKAIQQFSHLTSGNGTLTIAAGALASGTYQYSLLVNGKVIDTKQMVITK